MIHCDLAMDETPKAWRIGKKRRVMEVFRLSARKTPGSRYTIKVSRFRNVFLSDKISDAGWAMGDA